MYTPAFLLALGEEITWTYLKRLEDVQNVFWTAYVR